MNRFNLLLAFCALLFICCTSSCGSSGADLAETALTGATGATPALADGQDVDEIVGKSASGAKHAKKWRCVSKCWSCRAGNIQNLTATSAEDCINLTWDKVKHAHGYRVNYRKVGAHKWTFCGFSDTNSFKFCETADCTKYEFRVRALTCYCAGKWSAIVTSWVGGEPAAALPGAVSGLSLTAGETSITANWTAVDGAESYTFQYRAVGDEDWTEAGISTTPTFELNTGLLTCTRYEVRIRATNCLGDGEWSEVATGWIGSEPPTAAPGLVEGLALTAGDSSITANWTALAGAESYSVEYRAAGAADWTSAGLSTGTSLEIMGDLLACTNYEVRIRATNCLGDGEWSAAVMGHIGSEVPGSAPAAVVLTSVSTGDDDTISVAYETQASADSYEVSYRAQGDEAWTVAGISTTGSFDLAQNIVECTFYEVRVRATNCVGDGEYSTAGIGYIGENPDDCGEDECVPCGGSISELTLGYNGKKAGTVVVKDNAGAEVFSGEVKKGDTFTISGNVNGAFGNKLTLTINNKTVTLKTTCKSGIGIGTTAGNFAVVAGSSTAGELCPITPCQSCHKPKCKYHKKAMKCKARGDDKGCQQEYDNCRAAKQGKK
jgi:hypothetical protein